MASLDSAKNTFKKSVLGFGAGAAALVLVSTADAGNNDICLPLETVNGQTMSATTSANIYSRRNPGVVAISALPGVNMGNNPQNLTQAFRNNNESADCFVNNSMSSDRGTVYSLYVAGDPVSYNGRTRFGINEIRDNPQIIATARSEAATAKMLLTGGDVPPDRNTMAGLRDSSPALNN